MRHFLLLPIVLALLVPSIYPQSSIAPVRSEEVEQVDLGDNLQARFGYDGGIKSFYLPGREKPVEFPLGVRISQAVLSPDRRILVLRLSNQRPDSGFDYFGCFVCRRSDTTANAAWSVQYSLLHAHLLLRFDRDTRVQSIQAVTNEGVATLRRLQCEKQAPPTRVVHTWEEWDMFSEKQVKVLEEIKFGDAPTPRPRPNAR